MSTDKKPWIYVAVHENKISYYDNWDDCEAFVNGRSGALPHKFRKKKQATEWAELKIQNFITKGTKNPTKKLKAIIKNKTNEGKYSEVSRLHKELSSAFEEIG